MRSLINYGILGFYFMWTFPYALSMSQRSTKSFQNRWDADENLTANESIEAMIAVCCLQQVFGFYGKGEGNEHFFANSDSRQ
jgi:hypothetical protein